MFLQHMITCHYPTLADNHGLKFKQNKRETFMQDIRNKNILRKKNNIFHALQVIFINIKENIINK